MDEKLRILIVDDDPGMTRTTALILEHKGYRVDTAEDGLAAIDRVRTTPFDVILMNIKMPVMDGVETYKRIKAIQPGTAVIMMTAYAVKDLIAEALQEGAYGVLHKPLDIARLVKLIEEARKEQRGAMILVVDDDPGTCRTLHHILERKGYTVATAPDGETAIALAQGQHYDVVLIDMKLPALNGLETYLSIRQTNPGAVAILMTAYRQEMAELVEAALENSAYACLYKPLDLGELLELLECIVQRQGRKEMVDG